MNERVYISVILPLKLEWEPCYWTECKVAVGERVRVGFAGKEYIGVISATDIKPEIGSEKIRKVTAVEGDMERIFQEEIELWRKVAEYYLCSIGEVYKAAYPIGKINLEQAQTEARRKVCQRRERKVAVIGARLKKLQERLKRKKELTEKSKDGTRTKARYLEEIEKIKEDIILCERAKAEAERCLRAAEEGRHFEVSGPLVQTVILSEAQNAAYENILEGFDKGKPVLLHGVTGSGKTEIYIKLAQRAMNSGRNVLYLVPEIALSRQLEDRLYEHFGERLLIFHSGESMASRRNSAELIRSSSRTKGNYIALCTRSGIFLPHHDLGLVIVDEEHDGSYKQDSPAPRYNGRDTALILSKIHKSCDIILGSATPSLEELYNTNVGRHALVQLNERYHGSENSEIEIIDTKAERRKNGMSGNFSRKLIDRIRETLIAGEQILILRSRRAWSTALQCQNCGEIARCPHCNVSLSYHKTDNTVDCHYCGFKTAFSNSCRKCGSQLAFLGSGTQKIEEELSALFPEAAIGRLDSDSAQNKSYEARVIKDFTEGKIDILVGTQIVTKGFDFSNLSLVAIIAADTLLGIHDFRADEKALQIMEQFRGRCGRRNKRGLFIIQTSQPGHPIYRQIAYSGSTSAYDLMYERKDFDFPPYTRIIELTIKDIYEDKVERMSRRLAASLQKVFGGSGQNGFLKACPVTDSYSPVVDRIADRYIRKVRICFRKDKMLTANKAMLKRAIATFEKDERYEGHIVIDVDPS